MTASIKISACDNELRVIASTGAFSAEICHISSGNNDTVAYAVNLGSVLPGGTYSLTMVGINWGGPARFSVEVTNNGAVTPYSFEKKDAAIGVVWSPTIIVNV
ncbi:hypothetical protein [Duganella violaceipulchra]|uniref:Uncharacterized protein n=1 Tax=Duganella violaceipulchra TaxID=2849652 RepID=A0AA41HBQ2_9BURK|nr:hypothetical protein [Duganella violaceicalia]MBV6321201.1 hypothetical protein [Duganella violaceicalia]MCP2009553.1 hypothetical protein [Duganella violaceicalia]